MAGLAVDLLRIKDPEHRLGEGGDFESPPLLEVDECRAEPRVAALAACARRALDLAWRERAGGAGWLVRIQGGEAFAPRSPKRQFARP